jgi:hypothetical protein
MAEKTLKTRIIQKHEYEAHWDKAIGFPPPYKGEIIIYDAEADQNGNLLDKAELPEGRTTPYTYARYKIGDGVTSVSDLPFVDENCVKNTDYADTNKAGIMKVGPGLAAMGDGVVQIYPATENAIKEKKLLHPITAQFLDYAVKVGLTTNTETLTEEEKANACDWLGAASKDYVDEAVANIEIPVSDLNAIIDVTELPTTDIQENVFYRVLSGALVFNQFVQNAYTVYCVETLPTEGLPATNIEGTDGNVYYSVADNEAYGYVDTILSAGLGVPTGWYPAATLLSALG